MKVAAHFTSSALILLTTSHAWSDSNDDLWAEECLGRLFDPAIPIQQVQDAVVSTFGVYLFEVASDLPSFLVQQAQELYREYDGDVPAMVKDVVQAAKNSTVVKIIRNIQWLDPEAVVSAAKKMCSIVLSTARRKMHQGLKNAARGPKHDF